MRVWGDVVGLSVKAERWLELVHGGVGEVQGVGVLSSWLDVRGCEVVDDCGWLLVAFELPVMEKELLPFVRSHLLHTDGHGSDRELLGCFAVSSFDPQLIFRPVFHVGREIVRPLKGNARPGGQTGKGLEQSSECNHASRQACIQR